VVVERERKGPYNHPRFGVQRSTINDMICRVHVPLLHATCIPYPAHFCSFVHHRFRLLQLQLLKILDDDADLFDHRSVMGILKR